MVSGHLPQEQSALTEWRRHWPLVVAAMVGMSFYTVVTYSLGTFIEPLEQAFGWKRAQISFGLTIFAAWAAVGSPFVGLLIDRVGTRRIALVGLLLSGLAFAAFSLANGSPLQWYALWVVYGACALLIKTTVWSAGTSSVFSASRGLALAAVLSGSAIGQSLAPLIANALIASQGWRGAYRDIGFGWCGLALVLVLLFFFDARELGRRRGAAAAGDASAPPLPGLTRRDALRDSRIVRMAIANLLMSTAGAGVSVHLVPLIAETGLSRGAAVEIAATAGIAGLAGKFLTGWLLDRWQGNLVPFASFAIGALGHFLLLDLLHSTNALTAGAMALGFASGAGLQVTTYLVTRYAGLRNFGLVYGVISSMLMTGTALGPVLAGYIHDVTGHYDLLLYVASPMMLLCALLFVGLGPYPVFTTTGTEARS